VPFAFGVFLSYKGGEGVKVSQQAVSVDIIPNSAVGVFSQNQKEKRHKQLGYTDS
jgi:hypothetical protein